MYKTIGVYFNIIRYFLLRALTQYTIQLIIHIALVSYLHCFKVNVQSARDQLARFDKPFRCT